MTFLAWLPFLGVILPALVLAQNDATLQANTAGKAVAMATIQKLHEECLLHQDNLFLRRLAYVLTRYGTDSHTYRTGYDGGIWQVDENDFQGTKTNANDRATMTHFGFKWSDVTWSDLRKPLYSALAAGFLALSKAPMGKFPVAESEQAALYRKMYGGNLKDYLDVVKGLDRNCTSEELDIVFILDASGSVHPSDYETSKKFTAQVISKFDVGQNSVRVALISYSTRPVMYFDFSVHNSSQSAQQAALRIGKAGGGTSTWLALDMAASFLFSNTTTRDGVAKVAIVLTDGVSVLSLTNASAENLKKLNVEVFAVGIGPNTYEKELNAIASMPKCTHMREPKNFDELIPLIADIKDMSCNSPPVVDTKSNNTYSCLHEKTFKLALEDGDSILIRPFSGQVTLYGSFSTEMPNQAVNDFSGLARTWKPVVIYVTDTQGTISLTIEASSNQSGSCQSHYELIVYPKNILNFQVVNKCVKNRSLANCTFVEIFAGTANGIPPTNAHDVDQDGNVVTRDPGSNDPTPETVVPPTSSTMQCPGSSSGVYPHPTSQSHFVVCLETGDVYEMPCPVGLRYDVNTKMCSKATVTSSDNDMCKVCTRENWTFGMRKFALPGNATAYLACSYINTCEIRTCDAGKIWKESERECETVTPPPAFKPGPITFDCKSGSKGQFYFAYPGTARFFVICDEPGNAFLMECAPGTQWNQEKLSCAVPW